MDVQIPDGIDERPLPFSCFGLFGLTIYERKVIGNEKKTGKYCFVWSCVCQISEVPNFEYLFCHS